MELQAIRYAAMVSSMTFEKVVELHGEFLRKVGSSEDPRTSIMEFLKWDEPDEDGFAQDVRIVLVAAEFSKELTTAVMWLNDRDLDIRCVRIKPYSDDGRVLIDVQQVIPLPEAAQYQVQIREKKLKVREKRYERYDLRQHFWETLLSKANLRTRLHANISPGEYSYIATGSGVRGLNLTYSIRKEDATVELYIDRGDKDLNKRIFDFLHARKAEIEQQFGGALDWERLDERRACRISCTTTLGGYRTDEVKWPEIQDALIDAMIRLDRAFEDPLLRVKSEILPKHGAV